MQFAASVHDNNIIIDYAHALRIIANILSFYVFRVLEYMRCNDYYPENIKQLCLEIIQYEQELNSELNAIINTNLN